MVIDKASGVRPSAGGAPHWLRLFMATHLLVQSYSHEAIGIKQSAFRTGMSLQQVNTKLFGADWGRFG